MSVIFLGTNTAVQTLQSFCSSCRITSHKVNFRTAHFTGANSLSFRLSRLNLSAQPNAKRCRSAFTASDSLEVKHSLDKVLYAGTQMLFSVQQLEVLLLLLLQIGYILAALYTFIEIKIMNEYFLVLPPKYNFLNSYYDESRVKYEYMELFLLHF